VNVTFEPGMIPRTGNVVLRACVDHDCNERTFIDEPGSVLGVDVPSVPADADVGVAIKVFAKSGVVFSAGTAAHTTKWEPAGPGCCTKWRVYLHAHPKSRLTS
jgi:hypothetical protein